MTETPNTPTTSTWEPPLPTPPKKGYLKKVLIGGAIVLAFGMGVSVGSSGKDDPVISADASDGTAVTESTDAPASTAKPTTTTAKPKPTTTTAAPVLPPGPEDFSISLLETERSCFGSAGANVTVEPELSSLSIIPDEAYLIIFRIDGGEDGPETHSLELEADGQYSYTSEVIGTSTCSGTLTATITAVKER